jgi:hypothetical protein
MTEKKERPRSWSASIEPRSPTRKARFKNKKDKATSKQKAQGEEKKSFLAEIEPRRMEWEGLDSVVALVLPEAEKERFAKAHPVAKTVPTTWNLESEILHHQHPFEKSLNNATRKDTTHQQFHGETR